MPEVQTLFAETPVVNEECDRKRRDFGMLVVLIDMGIFAAFFHIASSNPGFEKLLQGLVGAFAFSGAVFWIIKNTGRFRSRFSSQPCCSG